MSVELIDYTTGQPTEIKAIGNAQFVTIPPPAPLTYTAIAALVANSPHPTHGYTVIATNTGGGYTAGYIYEYNATLNTFSLVQQYTSGAALVADQTLHAGEDTVNGVNKLEERFTSFSEISTATTTTSKAAAGFLHGLSINGGTLGAITIYDALTATGTPKFTITPSAGLLLPHFHQINAVFNTGITIVTAAATVLTPIGR